MPRKKSTRHSFSDIKQKSFILLFLLILFSLFTSYTPQAQPPTLSTQSFEPTPATKSSSLLPQVYADDHQEDYCVTVPVILYHHIQPLYLASEKHQEGLSVGVEYFDMHMNYLVSSGYTALSAERLVTALLNREELPQKSIVVTFDDGYEDNYLYAYPILKKYNITGNVFISTGLMEKEDYMTWEELGEMAESTLVKLYNHTTSHVDIGNASSDQAQKEITTAKMMLQEKLSVTSPIFAYPYGSTSPGAEKTLSNLGYIGAFTTQPGFTQCRSQVLNLHRNHVGNLPLSSYGL